MYFYSSKEHINYNTFICFTKMFRKSSTGLIIYNKHYFQIIVNDSKSIVQSFNSDGFIMVTTNLVPVIQQQKPCCAVSYNIKRSPVNWK